MTSAPANSTVRPHNRFFFSDDSLYLVVENSLYCVHRSLFEIHATMFPAHALETSRNKPYVLRDVKKSDFDCLLAHLYPRTLGTEETETAQDWISILELASKWGFNTLRSKAISKIEHSLDSPVDMVTIGRQYGIPDVLLPGYAVLCQSTDPLSYEEGLRLGMEDVVNIYRIRHELYGSGITPVPLEVAFAKVEEADLRADNVSGPNPGSSVSTKEVFRLIEELAGDIIQWLNTTNIQTLHQIMRLIVEKAIEAFEHNNPSICLCRIMVKHTQTLHRMTRMIVEKAVEEPHKFTACARLCNMMMKDSDGDVPWVGSSESFRIYLGEICLENLETIAASVAAAAAGELEARVQRRRLIEFIGALADLKVMNMCAQPFSMIDDWVTALLDANDEEKVATLCMVMKRANHFCTLCNMASWVPRVRNVVQKTSKPQVRIILQNTILTNGGSYVHWTAARLSEG